jgi:hypothetical protein
VHNPGWIGRAIERVREEEGVGSQDRGRLRGGEQRRPSHCEQGEEDHEAANRTGDRKTPSARYG